MPLPTHTTGHPIREELLTYSWQSHQNWKPEVASRGDNETKKNINIKRFKF